MTTSKKSPAERHENSCAKLMSEHKSRACALFTIDENGNGRFAIVGMIEEQREIVDGLRAAASRLERTIIRCELDERERFR